MAEPVKEKWTQWVALTTTVLAVCAAISSLRASSFSTRVQLATSAESSGWAYFQAKSIKQHTCETERDTMRMAHLEARTAAGRAFAASAVQRYDADIARYDREKSEIKKTAEHAADDSSRYKLQSATLGTAVMMLQIAIMLSSVSALLKRPGLWYVGLAAGVVGLAVMVNGFYLWF